jgi:hypothetical protein
MCLNMLPIVELSRKVTYSIEVEIFTINRITQRMKVLPSGSFVFKVFLSSVAPGMAKGLVTLLYHYHVLAGKARYMPVHQRFVANYVLVR